MLIDTLTGFNPYAYPFKLLPRNVALVHTPVIMHYAVSAREKRKG